MKVVSKGGVFEGPVAVQQEVHESRPVQFRPDRPWSQLLSTTDGLSNLLTMAQNPRSGPAVRLSGELLDTVSYTVPGKVIPVLPDLAPDRPVSLTVSIDPQTYELRQVTLVGPFTTASYDTTYVITLTNYDEDVTVTLPATS